MHTYIRKYIYIHTHFFASFLFAGWIVLKNVFLVLPSTQIGTHPHTSVYRSSPNYGVCVCQNPAGGGGHYFLSFPVLYFYLPWDTPSTIVGRPTGGSLDPYRNKPQHIPDSASTARSTSRASWLCTHNVQKMERQKSAKVQSWRTLPRAARICARRHGWANTW